MLCPPEARQAREPGGHDRDTYVTRRIRRRIGPRIGHFVQVPELCVLRCLLRGGELQPACAGYHVTTKGRTDLPLAPPQATRHASRLTAPAHPGETPYR